MEFFDRKDRELTEEVYTIKNIKDISGKEGFEIVRELPQTQKEAFIKTTVDLLDIGDPIYDASTNYITHRTK